MTDLPWWRLFDLVKGVLRSFIWFRKASLKHISAIHSGARIKEWKGSVMLGHKCELHERVMISATGTPEKKALVQIGNQTTIWYNTVISARHEIIIGDNCAISWNCTIIDDDMHTIVYPSNYTPKERGNFVHLGNRVWLGANVTVLKGVTIADDVIVAAGSVVTKDLASKWIYAGNPAKPIAQVETWY
ncbi:MAG: acyltransferase [Bacteroidetes Order II. Incertae sedis bacterium]|nr:acyltransferase [Bacteroidetes Order II. bacterium]